jgi:outer membrane protein assembly factor BamB
MYTAVFCSDGRRLVLGQASITFGAGGKVLAIDVDSGTIAWEHDVSDLPLRMPGEEDRLGAPTGVARLHRNVVVITVSKDFLVGLSIESGNRLWTWTSTLRNAVVAGAGYLYGGRYYQTGATGSYHIIDVVSGKTIFETLIDRNLPSRQRTAWGWFPVLVSETHLFVGSKDGHILVFERDTGDYAWSILPKRGSAISRFACVNERLYCGDLGGRLHCLAAKRS